VQRVFFSQDVKANGLYFHTLLRGLGSAASHLGWLLPESDNRC